MELSSADLSVLLDALKNWHDALEYDRKNLPKSEVVNSPIVPEIRRTEQLIKKLQARATSFSLQELNTMQAALGEFYDFLAQYNLSDNSIRNPLISERLRRINRLKRNVLTLLRSHSEKEDRL